ncbi:DUF4176 domain-containing protein [Virgibacillus dakarensis]|nr:DUF4176 domain-containing protein [Virgibacillus dakarensis]
MFNDLEENLQQHIKSFASNVDCSDSAIIKSNYLQDVKEDINEVFEDLEKQDEIIHNTIQEVSDISSAAPPSFADVNEWKKKAVKKITELDEDLSSFNGVGDKTASMELLPLGSVVKLKNGEQKIMITVRLPLYNNKGTIGYFHYGACLFPNGQVDQKTYFFNNSDIEEIFFKGYIDELEEDFQKKYQEEIKNIQYPQLELVQQEAEIED